MSDSSSVIRADVRMKFYYRFLLIGVGALAGAAYFFYDGLVTYPHQRQVWDAYIKLNPNAATDDHHGGHGEEASHAPPEDFPQKEWDALVAENGWQKSVKPLKAEEGEAASYGEPEGKHWNDWKIQEQIVIGGLLTPVGLGFLLKVLLARGLWIESDGRGVTSSWGKGFKFEDVVEINKKKWQDKGLAYVKFRDGGGTSRFTIDDLKFYRKPTDSILYQLEQAVGVDKIIGGVPERDPDAPPPTEEDAKPTGEALSEEPTAASE